VQSGRALDETKKPLSDTGIVETRTVAATLAEVLGRPALDGSYETIQVGLILHGSAVQVRDTAAILIAGSTQLDASSVAVECDNDLDSGHFSLGLNDMSGDDGSRMASRLLRAVNGLTDGNNTVLVVGHQPHLGWTSGHLQHGRFRPGHPIPFSHSEIACIAVERPRHLERRLQASGWLGRIRGRPPYLAWVLAADDRAAAEEIRQKIRSKMDAAKQLGALLGALVGILFGVLLDPTKLATVTRPEIVVAAGLFLVSIVLFLRSMYAYDSLLMPSRFWGDTRPQPGRRFWVFGPRTRKRRRWLVARPPSSSAWILYQNMLRTWNYLFTPASVAAVLGLALLGYGALRPTGWTWLPIGAAVLTTATACHRFRPVLGSQD
jgi:phosphohistidine phosphatase SixA